ncbi:hypothetical protein MGH68_10490 [Erysipelothrix sp. D19-032]
MKRNGTLIGLGSGLFWGLDTVLLGIATSSALFLTTLAGIITFNYNVSP